MTQDTSLRRMTPEQWRRWDEDGYLILEGALSDNEVNDLTAEVDKLDAESQRLGRDPNTLLHAVNIIDRATEGLFQPDLAKAGRILRPEPSDTLLNLIDHPNHLGIVCDLIGPAILLSWAEAMVRPPNPKPSNRWHKDGSKPYYFPQIDGRTPLLWARIGFFLNDLASPDMGNFTVIPGSHRTGFPQIDQGVDHALTITSYGRFTQVERIDEGVPGARQLTLKAGDAVIFHNAIWHCVPRNTSNVRRKNLWYIYAPIWFRTGDRTRNSPEVLDRCGPVRRQLLGELTGPNTNGGIHPFDEGVPLVRLFEGKSFQETWDALDEKYIRATQM